MENVIDFIHLAFLLNKQNVRFFHTVNGIVYPLDKISIYNSTISDLSDMIYNKVIFFKIN